MHRDNGRNHKNTEGYNPMTPNGADGQAQKDVDDMGAPDEHQMNEALIHRLVRRHIVACRHRIFDRSVIDHSVLQMSVGKRELAQLT